MTYQVKTNQMDNKSGKSSFLSGGKMMIATLVIAFVSMISFSSKAETGEELFTKTCSICHSLTDKSMVGPGLGGLNEKRDEEWSIKWIRNSSELIASGDEDAIAIFKEYNSIPMTNFTEFSDDDIKGLLAYIGEAGSVGGDDVAASGTTTTNVAANGDNTTAPINSEWLFWSVIIIGFVIFFMVRFVKKTKEKVEHMGFHPDAHKVSNYPGIFAVMILVALAAIYLLVNLLENNTGMVNTMMFMVLPYAAFGIFIVGSIYRYTKKGYKVSSLSSQFVEGKQLFWGSQPFHWGILVILVGHLIAFLFPSSLTAWNGMPWRRLILEISSFAFGLSALLGLILLMKRRLTNKKLLVVTNKMDMVVYTILFVQVISGLGVAFFVRWGSEWFASVLTPYLRSIFSFSPDISSMAEMPWWIQLHVISAFIMIGIIPFTRFMHFLVAPVDYAWRKYQVVIWNWNRKAIRNSTQHTFGKKTRNH